LTQSLGVASTSDGRALVVTGEVLELPAEASFGPAVKTLPEALFGRI
jgi:hypothetical protein